MKYNDSRLLPYLIVVAATPLLALSVTTGPNAAWASKTIVQDPTAAGASATSGWLAFEAEDYDHLIDLDGDGVSWSVVDDVDASGGKVLQSDAGAGLNAGGEADAVYKVKFTIPDFYKVYARYKNFGISGRRSSIWTSGDANPPFPDNKLKNWFGDGSSEAEIVRSLGDDTFFLDDDGNGGFTPEYFYSFLGAAWIGSDTANQNAGDIDEVLEFRIGVRTELAVLDKIIFVDATNPGPTDMTFPPFDPEGLGFRYQPTFQLDALPNSIVEFVGDPADLDGDGDVDGADFLAIQRSDSSLIPAWQTSYGTGSGSAASIAAVPEPSSCLLLLAGSLFAAVRRRR
jgi:hypothetical protein